VWRGLQWVIPAAGKAVWLPAVVWAAKGGLRCGLHGGDEAVCIAGVLVVSTHALVGAIRPSTAAVHTAHVSLWMGCTLDSMCAGSVSAYRSKGRQGRVQGQGCKGGGGMEALCIAGVLDPWLLPCGGASGPSTAAVHTAHTQLICWLHIMHIPQHIVSWLPRQSSGAGMEGG
jgi:hypothetical protein